jgi:hypothetical protein
VALFAVISVVITNDIAATISGGLASVGSEVVDKLERCHF